ncbi:hypothetical protein L1887_25409 [Cichorium endivia]|nr:hypothetical protein L1887_25409 [Cichorium endivia]
MILAYRLHQANNTFIELSTHNASNEPSLVGGFRLPSTHKASIGPSQLNDASIQPSLVSDCSCHRDLTLWNISVLFGAISFKSGPFPVDMHPSFATVVSLGGFGVVSHCLRKSLVVVGVLMVYDESGGCGDGGRKSSQIFGGGGGDDDVQ